MVRPTIALVEWTQKQKQNNNDDDDDVEKNEKNHVDLFVLGTRKWKRKPVKFT